MDQKLFAAAQQGMGMNQQQQGNPQQQQQQGNPLMMNFQQQTQQAFNPLATGANVPSFNPANLGFGQGDFSNNNNNNLDPTDLNSLNPFIQANPSLMNGMNVLQQQPQHLRQNSNHSSNNGVYSPQNLMAFNNPQVLQQQFHQQQQQQRNMYANQNMMNTPQALLFQQQQQQQQQRKQQSPSQSPALNQTFLQQNNNNNASIGSPIINSPHYAVSPMNPNMSSPIVQQQQLFNNNGISPSPQLSRVIPSQNNHIGSNNSTPSATVTTTTTATTAASTNTANIANTNRFMHLNNNTNTNYMQSPQLQQQNDIMNLMEDQQPKSNPYTQQQQQQTSPIPRQSVTPKSTHSTPKSPSPKPTNIYIPKTRNVETYGGIDLKYFDKFEIKPQVAHLNELGLIDIQSIIMSLKSGMKMEMTNALNILTMLTIQHLQPQSQQPRLLLSHCDDLLDVLLDYLEKDIFQQTTADHEMVVVDDLTYTELFDMSLDEMKSLIPKLEDNTSDVWISLRERCLCIFNILRNVSFMNENMEHLSKHARFLPLMIKIVDNTRRVSAKKGFDTTGNQAWFVGIRRMDTLDFRKSILMIFSNISMFLSLKNQHITSVFLQLIHDFLVYGPDTYYSLLAIETWSKLTVNYENRKLLHQLIDNSNHYRLLQEIWSELSDVIRRDFFSMDGRVMHAMTSNQLATLELTMIGLYNIISIIENDNVKQQLALENKSFSMMIMRLSITLAESGNPQFGLVTKRGMELIRSLICGGDGIRRKNLNTRPSALELLSTTNKQQQQQEDNDNEPSDKLSISEIANRILDMPVVREKLMLSMLKPTTDPEILRELSDIVNLIDEDATASLHI